MDRFLKISAVPNHLAISKPTLYRWIAQGKFISPIVFGGNTSIIKESELKEYMSRVVAGENRQTITADIEMKRTKKLLAATH
ncbi:hypothetical protein BCT82_05490 [Vibrio breoganii]|uniref:helix-turn-helix transcriptional regulator n=1 Tax=Vibrio breoganii TaxID=553239 RepID=UPI000C84C059|nr:helix-turn-helix domain-containing protein [Vibrio breoganii]PML28916.1 hypothetical protein BCT82_05490 [Vibrio breoganii]